MTRIALCMAAASMMVAAPFAPAFAIIHNSPLLTKSTGPKCPEGFVMKSSGHGALWHQECVKKGA